MADISAAGETFVDGQAVTATRLNNHVTGLTIGPGLISGKAATAPATGDKVLVGDISNVNALIGPTILQILALQVSDAADATPSMRTLGNTGAKAAKGSETPNLNNSNAFVNDNQFTQIGGTYLGVLAIAAGAGLGTNGSPAATLSTNSTGLYGRINLTSGSTGGTGTVATITLDKTFLNAPFIFIVPYNAAAQSNQAGTSRITVGTVNSTSFTITNTVALPLSTNISYNYLVLGL